MLSIMNEIDPWMSLPLWVLYGIQNQIFLQNANAKGFDKDRKQSSSFQIKNKDKGKKDARDGG